LSRRAGAPAARVCAYAGGLPRLATNIEIGTRIEK
jgi:hypothetical protein